MLDANAALGKYQNMSNETYADYANVASEAQIVINTSAKNELQ